VILEVVDIHIKADQHAAFESAVHHGIQTVIAHAKGYRHYQLQRGIESAQRYVLLIWWATLENHTVDFRQSPAFTDWRAIVGPFFAQPPVVEHFHPLASPNAPHASSALPVDGPHA
jgi:heme-degrading monooxygenase HmoA